MAQAKVRKDKEGGSEEREGHWPDFTPPGQEEALGKVLRRHFVHQPLAMFPIMSRAAVGLCNMRRVFIVRSRSS